MSIEALNLLEAQHQHQQQQQEEEEEEEEEEQEHTQRSSGRLWRERPGCIQQS